MLPTKTHICHTCAISYINTQKPTTVTRIRETATETTQQQPPATETTPQAKIEASHVIGVISCA
jgi:hypothetical protein